MAQRLPFSSEQYWNACKRNAFKGACMYTNEAGTTTTRKVTYTTADESVAHPNPIQADSNGIFPEIYGVGGFYIRIENNAKDELILEADNIEGVGSTSFMQVGSLSDAINSLTAVGSFIETYEYTAGTGVGGGKYQKVSVDPGNNLINPATTDGNWLRRILSDTETLYAAGITFDGE